MVTLLLLQTTVDKSLRAIEVDVVAGMERMEETRLRRILLGGTRTDRESNSKG